MSVVTELIEDTDNVHISDGVSRHVSRLETVSRHGFSCLGLGSVSTLVLSCVGSVSGFHVSSCLTSHDCVSIRHS